MLFGNLVHFAAGILRFCHGEVGPVPYAGRGGISYAGVKWGGVTHAGVDGVTYAGGGGWVGSITPRRVRFADDC